MFDRKGDGWTGGDGTLSVCLKDGRTVWLFGDTFLGKVKSDGTRPKETPMIRNSLVVQTDRRLDTRYRQTEKGPAAFFPGAFPDTWYWPGDGLAAGNKMRVFLNRFRKSAPQLWAWQFTGTVLATLSLPDLELEGLDETATVKGVLFGVSVLKTKEYVYIYGTRDDAFPKLACLARATTGSLSGPWEYYTGRGWSADPKHSAPILSGVSTQYSVFQTDGLFYLVTMDGRGPFPDTIAVYRSGSPGGPWQGPRIIYKVPGVGRDVVAYNPFVHTQFTEGHRYLISYNLNHVSNPSAVYDDATIYRPQFIWVDFAVIEQRLFQ
ncbi:DUF5005 domain-containing protein [uncultured Desulfosarcina sp.]|uniref:DUF5005 domain-containing protein n=1 Tax=uncultured Desulfosarcina sp. TaxID=218289 RepID=UPI0029C80051|nr:DUF5005 domain-containing protein [uncultured Desulfosarcina sp.]